MLKMGLALGAMMLVCAFGSHAMAKDLYTYDCGASGKLVVKKNRAKYSVEKQYEKMIEIHRHVVTIESHAATLKNLTAIFNGGDLTVDDETASESGLPKGSVAFIGFHYASGEMYMSAEEETGEEGYTLAAEKGLLEGAKTVQVADIFWSDRLDSKVTKYTCNLVE